MTIRELLMEWMGVELNIAIAILYVCCLFTMFSIIALYWGKLRTWPLMKTLFSGLHTSPRKYNDKATYVLDEVIPAFFGIVVFGLVNIIFTGFVGRLSWGVFISIFEFLTSIQMLIISSAIAVIVLFIFAIRRYENLEEFREELEKEV